MPVVHWEDLPEEMEICLILVIFRILLFSYFHWAVEKRGTGFGGGGGVGTGVEVPGAHHFQEHNLFFDVKLGNINFLYVNNM